MTLESDVFFDSLAFVVFAPLSRLLRGMPILYRKESDSLVDYMVFIVSRWNTFQENLGILEN